MTLSRMTLSSARCNSSKCHWFTAVLLSVITKCHSSYFHFTNAVYLSASLLAVILLNIILLSCWI
jgi:hypothetical protein